MKNLLLAVLVGLLVLSVSGRPISTSDDSRKRNRQDKKDKSNKEDAIELGTALVTTDVSVRDRHSRFIADLTSKDFHVFDNGVEQKISFFGSNEEPFSVVIVLDNSGSAIPYLKDEQDLAVAFVNELHPADRVAVIRFSDLANSLLPYWSNNKEALTKAIRDTRAGGSTSLFTTLTGVANLLREVKGRKAIMILSDGFDTNGGVDVNSVLRDFQEIDAVAYVVRYKLIGGSRPVNSLKELYDVNESESFLDKLTEATGGVFINGKPDDQKKFSNTVAEELRHQYILGYYPNNAAKRSKKNSIKIKVDRPNVNVRSRRSYASK